MSDEEVMTTTEAPEIEETTDFLADTGETAVEEPETEQTELETEPETPPQPPKGASRTEIARWLREIGENDPDRKQFTKELTQAMFSRDAYKDVFPDINDARTLKATLESIGGMDGLQELQTYKDEFANLDKMLDSGDPALVDEILSQSPDGFKKIVPYAFQQLQKMDPEAYNDFLNPLLREQVVNSQIGIQLEAVMASLQGNDPELAMRRLVPALNWYKNIAQQAQDDQRMGHQPAAAPSSRNDELDDREYQMNKRDVNREMNSYSLEQVKDSLKSYLRGVKLPESAINDLYRGTLAEIGQALMADETFQSRIDNMVRRGDIEAAIRYAKPFIDKAKAEAAKSVWSTRYGHLKAATPSATSRGRSPSAPRTQVPSNTGEIQIPKPPPLEAIDRRRTTQDMMISHKAILTDGRRVTWPR